MPTAKGRKTDRFFEWGCPLGHGRHGTGQRADTTGISKGMENKVRRSHTSSVQPFLVFSPFWDLGAFLFKFFNISIILDIQHYVSFRCTYNIEIRRLYNLKSDHPNKSSTHLTPCIVITVLLTIFPMPYFTSPWLFCNWQFVLLDLFTFFTHPLSPPPICQPSGTWVFLFSSYSSYPFLGLGKKVLWSSTDTVGKVWSLTCYVTRFFYSLPFFFW